MSLTPGSRFGTFEVVAPLGAGAMGEVYRARDTKLHRTVALKVLPERVADDPERLARLKREAQTLGRLLAYVEIGEGGQDIWVQDLSDPARPRRALINTDALESFPEFSPDGKWLAYVSNGSGRAEVFVQPFPGPGPRVQISFNGGSAPAWNRDGTELYFFAAGTTPGHSAMMAADIRATPNGLIAGTPRRLFEGRHGQTGPVRGYDVTPDCRRFLMVHVRDLPPQPPVELVLVQNWAAALPR